VILGFTSVTITDDARAGRDPPYVPLDAPLATLNTTTDMWSFGTYTTVAFVFTMDPDGNHYDLGDGLRLADGGTGTFNFTAADDADFPRISRLLTNGLNDMIELDSLLDGGSGIGGFEDYWLGNPDLVGFEVRYVHLVVHSLSIRPEGTGTRLLSDVAWEIWGVPVFVAFVPPTDSDGTYLIERDYTFINVTLSSPGTASLEWGGINETMIGSGTNWYVNKSGLANGVYRYRVWANDSSGTVYASEERVLTVGFRVWTLEDLGQGYYPALTYDVSGSPRLCYYDGSQLAYGRRVGPWQTAVVEGGGLNCAIGLDAAGNPHISYNWEPGGDSIVRYATFDGTAWTRETVESTSFTTYTSLAVDPVRDEPAIAYYESFGRDLKFARRTAGAWSREIVDATGDTGMAPSLAFDSQGRPRIAYFNFDRRQLKYAAWDGASWQIQVVDTVSYLTEDQISLALDANGIASIAYVHPDGVRLATANGSSWDHETVDTRPVIQVSLAVDGNGSPHIAYGSPGERFPDRDLWYATKSSSWEFELVAHEFGYSGISLGLNATGQPGVAYCGGAARLIYAYKSPPGGDGIPPTTVATSNGAQGRAGWFVGPVSVELTASDSGSGVASTSYRLDGGSWQTYGSPLSLAGDGSHRLEYYSADLAGNIESTRTLVIGIDSAAPVTGGVLQGTLGLGGWYVTTVSLVLSASDATSGVSLIEYRVNDGPWQAYGSSVVFDADGVRDIDFRATDIAGNEEPFGSATLRIDRTAPTMEHTASGTAGSPGWFRSAVTLALLTSDAGSGVASVEYELDAGGWQAYGSPIVVTDGRHTLEYRSRDVAGNLAPPVTVPLNVDSVAPRILSLSPTGIVTTSSVAVKWNATDATAGIAAYDLSLDGSPYEPVGMGTELALTLSDGMHVVSLRATDAAGNTATTEVRIVVDTNVFSLTGPFSGLPTFALIAIAVIAGILVLVTLRRRKRSNGKPPPATGQGDRAS